MHRRWLHRNTDDDARGVTLIMLDNHWKDDNMDAATDNTTTTTNRHNNTQRRRDAGFTLMEMTMVVIILGLLAVTAIPKVVDLHGSANRAAAEGVASNVSTAFAMNYAVSLSGGDAEDFVEGSTLTPTLISYIIDIDANNYDLSCGPLSAPGIPTTCEVQSDGVSFDPPVNFFAIATLVAPSE